MEETRAISRYADMDHLEKVLDAETVTFVEEGISQVDLFKKRINFIMNLIETASGRASSDCSWDCAYVDSRPRLPNGPNQAISR